MSTRRIKKRIRNAINAIIGNIYCKINPVGYAKKLGVKVGKNVHIYGANRGMFSTEPWVIKIGDNVHITKEVQFLTHDGGTLIIKEHIGDYILTGPIVIGDNTYIGTRTIIMPGVNIGKNCIIGAGSIVTKDIPDNSVAVGVPARVHSTLEQYINKIKCVMNGEMPRYYESLEAVRSLNPKRKVRK